MTDLEGYAILELSGGRIVCPACGKKTDQAVLADTAADRLPVYCKRCKREILVRIENRTCQCLSPSASARA